MNWCQTCPVTKKNNNNIKRLNPTGRCMPISWTMIKKMNRIELIIEDSLPNSYNIFYNIKKMILRDLDCVCLHHLKFRIVFFLKNKNLYA